jgi:phospholipid-binding lipoprotein MlaA
MLKKIIIIFFLSSAFFMNAIADTDGENSVSKKNSGATKDCFEKVNRGVFAFNQGLDKVLFEPLAKGYRKIPSPIRAGTGNILNNLSNLITIPNNILQGDLLTAGGNSVRLVLNTTVGILGIFDPASKLGFEKYEKEDYGQSLGKWGVGPGCYIVLPILGPSTARDTLGSLTTFVGGDAWYNVTVKKDTHYFSDFDYYASRGTAGIDFRAKNLDAINNLEKNSMDFYSSVKSLYLQDRKRKVTNSKQSTNAMDDGDWEEIETN